MQATLSGRTEDAARIGNALVSIGLSPVAVSVCGRNVLVTFHGRGPAYRAAEILSHMGRTRVIEGVDGSWTNARRVFRAALTLA